MHCLVCNKSSETTQILVTPRHGESGKLAQTMCQLFNLPLFPYKGYFQKAAYCLSCKNNVYRIYCVLRKKGNLKEQMGKLRNLFKYNIYTSLQRRGTSSSQTLTTRQNILQELDKSKHKKPKRSYVYEREEKESCSSCDCESNSSCKIPNVEQCTDPNCNYCLEEHASTSSAMKKSWPISLDCTDCMACSQSSQICKPKLQPQNSMIPQKSVPKFCSFRDCKIIEQPTNKRIKKPNGLLTHPAICNICGQVFKSKTTLKIHQCIYDNKLFSRQEKTGPPEAQALKNCSNIIKSFPEITICGESKTYGVDPKVLPNTIEQMIDLYLPDGFQLDSFSDEIIRLETPLEKI